jgi:hypothetical protein
MSSGEDDRRCTQVQRVECVAALVLLAGIALLHGRVLFHAGALWRDEVNTVNVAGKPTLHEFWSALEFDAQPALWPLVLRGWLATGWGAGDFQLRILGCAIGLCALVVLWWNARLLSRGRGWPGLSWLLLGASPILFKWGDSLRAYGLGMVLSLLAFGAIWKLVERPSRRAFTLAALAALLSVHTLYSNSVMLLVLCASGAVVRLRRRDWNGLALLLLLGLVCALSLLPYLPQIAGARDWGKVIRTPVTAIWLVQQFGEALRTAGDLMLVVWIVLWVGALAGCVRCWWSGTGSDTDRALFLGCVLSFGPMLYLGFFMVLSYATAPWYFLVLIGFMAVAIDAAWELVLGNSFADRAARLTGCLLLAACIATPTWQAASQRRTTVDLSASLLAEHAADNDLILITNWAPGISFARYYGGSTPWVTLPDLPDYTVHRFDLVARRMAETDPLQDVMRRLSDTLQAGHRVWVLGPLPFHLHVVPAPLPLAPGAASGWQEFAYSRQWQAEVSVFLRDHATQIETVLPPLPPAQVDNYENLPLTVASGWR